MGSLLSSSVSHFVKKEMVQPFFYQGALTPLIIQHYNYGQGSRHGDGIIHGFLTLPLLT
jgi:hypothetical protein